MTFFGDSYSRDYDYLRLSSQLARVKYVMLKGGWHTLSELQTITGGSEASLSARLRQLRSQDYFVDRRRKGEPENGLFEYRLSKPDEKQKGLF